jgi:RHS repeat-associated protein
MGSQRLFIDARGCEWIDNYNLRFPGHYYNQETGLFDYYFRDYDPQTGRYLESDPIGLRAGVNTYAYATRNPLSESDPFGLYGGWIPANGNHGPSAHPCPTVPTAPPGVS